MNSEIIIHFNISERLCHLITSGVLSGVTVSGFYFLLKYKTLGISASVELHLMKWVTLPAMD